MDLWHTEIKSVSMRIWQEMRQKCNVGTLKAKSVLNKDEGRSSKNMALNTLFSVCACVERGWEEEMLLFVECLSMLFICKVVRKWGVCGWSWGRIFPWGQAQTGVVDRLGRGHQSCNSCEQYWCKLTAQKGSSKQLSAPPSPCCPPKNVPPHQIDVRRRVHLAQSCKGLWNG